MTAAYGRPHCALFTVDLDGATVTIRRALEREPPFDDERHLDDVEPVDRSQRVLPFPPLHPPPWQRLSVLTRSARRASVPEPAVWARRLLIGVVEAASQRRPLRQLDSMLSPGVSLGLRGDLGMAIENHRLRGATVGSLRATEPTDGVAELCATLCAPTRIHAVALRLEIRRGQWICTRLVLG